MYVIHRNIFVFTKEELRKLFEGKRSEARFFGRKKGRWVENAMVELGNDWLINYPGYHAGIALLRNVYGFEDLSPSSDFLSMNNEKTPEPTLIFK